MECYRWTLTLLSLPVSKDSAGGVDEDDFVKAFTDVPTVQVQDTYIKKHFVAVHYYSAPAVFCYLLLFFFFFRFTQVETSRTTLTRFVKSAPMTNMTGTREPTLSVESLQCL